MYIMWSYKNCVFSFFMEKQIQAVIALENIETGTGFSQLMFSFLSPAVRLFFAYNFTKGHKYTLKPFSECRHRICQHRLLETKARIFIYPLIYGEIIFGTGTGNRILVMGLGLVLVSTKSGFWKQIRMS
jgi:hypothetical protein